MALKPLNSVGGFSVGEVPANVILANADITANKGTFSGNLAVSNATASWGILTDNLYYSNGVPWDLQEAAGSNNEIQFNSNDDFAASANLTFDPATNLLTVVGNTQFNNANLGNLAIANFVNVASNVVTSNLTVNTSLSGNTANFSGNVVVPNLAVNLALSGNTANFSGNVVLSGATVTVDNELDANTANFSGNVVLSGATVTVDNELDANTANFSGNATFSGAEVVIDNELSGNTANFTGNVTAENFIGNVSGNLTISAPNTSVIYSSNGAAVGSNNFTWDYSSNVLTVDGTANITGNTEVGGILTDNYYYANGAPVDFQQPAGSNTQIQFNDADDFGASANLTWDFSSNTLTVLGNANITTVNSSNIVGGGTDVTINANGYVSTFYGADGNVSLPAFLDVTDNVSANWFVGNLSGNAVEANFANIATTLTGNVANFSGNLTAANANLGNLATANYINVANDLNVVGNVNAGNLVGILANGNSNVTVFANANVEFSSTGNANVVTITQTELLSVGNIRSTSGNIVANGNVTANGFLVGANASISGEANVGSLRTANITALSGDIVINAGANGTIDLIPNGTGTVSVNGFRITQVPDPVDPLDAANKEYVDALAGEGLVIHTPVRVESESALNATYAQGGTTPTVTAIANGTDITFSAAHGLSVNDGIVFDNTFNGLTAGEAYWVYSVVDSTTITVKDGYFGAQVTGLTNGTGLTQSSRANPGVGATLTNAGANAALQIDGITLSTSDRVLVYTQSNAFENGIYTVTTVGDGSTAWVLTRATDFDKYIPGSSVGVGKGSYVFVTQGLTGAGESYVMTAPSGEVVIGTDNITFTQFSAAGAYTAGNGIAITGTVISANTDGITTAIVGGNIVVKASANLTTPNIGDATFSSLSWNTLSNGNVTANNLSISNIANIDLDLTVGGNIQANGTISSNANVSGLNITTNGNVTAAGDVVANNVTGNTLLTVPTANVSNIVNAGNVTITNELSGNTANFSGNIVVNNATVNLELAGNTANFSGNVILSAELSGNTANFSGNVVVPNLTVNSELAGNTANFTGNVTTANLATTNLVVANTLTANNAVNVGNTAVTWGTVTTTAITANQVIAQSAYSGVTGIEFLVKGEDSAGSKYSMATVQAVTDGSNVDYSTFGTVNIGGTTGVLSVGISGSNLELRVTPSSTNSTVWTTQYRTI